MTGTEIKIELMRRGISQVSLARALGVTPTTVFNTIHNGLVSHRIRVAIAEAAGMDVADIWPSYYRQPRTSRLGRPPLALALPNFGTGEGHETHSQEPQ